MIQLSTQHIQQSDFGTAEGKPVYLFTLSNSKGSEVRICNYGGILSSWRVANRQGGTDDIVLGFNSLEEYLHPHPYIGVIAGPYANRIAGGRFELDGDMYQLETNEGRHHLHGGASGLDTVVWDAAIEQGALLLSYRHTDRKGGYPGNLTVQVRFLFDDDDALSIAYTARTDKATPVNLTSHGYFNLSGNASHSILNHKLRINGAYYTPVDQESIPTGEIRTVAGTSYDFTTLRTIGAGYDHNFVLNGPAGLLKQAALLTDPLSGRKLEVLTTEPGLQLYTGSHLDGSFTNRDGKAIGPFSGICLETQHFPDAPNQPHFPGTILRPGCTYHSHTVYRLYQPHAL